MSKRIFIAIPLSSELEQIVTDWQAKHASLPVRWVKGENLHFTVVPPWEVDDVQPIIDKLNTLSLDFFPFTIQLHQIRLGPERFHPSLIWAEGQTPQKLFDLKSTIEHALRLTSAAQSLRLHITLARFKTEDFARFPNKELTEHIQWRQIVNSFVVMESHRLAEGADYEVLAKIPSKS
jgi:2'-5' RNA ligase